MRLHIKQKVMSLRDRFEVTDECGGVRWRARGELRTWGRKLHVYDAQGEEVALLREKVWCMIRARYYLEIMGSTHTLV